MLLIGLGVWQWHRAEIKENLNRYQKHQHDLPILSENDLNTCPLSQLKLRQGKIKGTFHPNYVYLLDNQTHQGQVGYHVLALFKPDTTNDTDWILVNRGWIPGLPLRSELPKISIPLDKIEIEGLFYLPTPSPFNSHMAPEDNLLYWPRRIQMADFIEIANELSISLIPMIFNLSDHSQAVLGPLPMIKNRMTPERHRGYALQWAGLAVVWLVGNFILLKTSKKRKSGDLSSI